MPPKWVSYDFHYNFKQGRFIELVAYNHLIPLQKASGPNEPGECVYSISRVTLVLLRCVLLDAISEPSSGFLN